jgi:hypothetical protein
MEDLVAYDGWRDDAGTARTGAATSKGWTFGDHRLQSD